MTTRSAFALAAVVSAAVALSAADARRAFGVGVLRRDGILIPFATFDGGSWRNSWPGPQQADLSVPINVASVPRKWWGPTGPLEAWQASLDSGDRPIRVTQPDWVAVHCVRHVALRTDYKSDAIVPAQQEQPFPKDGIATSPAQRVQRIEILSPMATELDALAPAMTESFNLAERKTVRDANHPVPRRVRENVTPHVEAAYAYGTSPRYYYVEATRAYRTLSRDPDDCAATAFGTGWFVRDGQGVRSVLMSVDLLPCDFRGVSYMLPLGAIDVAGRVFWVAQFSGWDHERYVVVEPTPKKVEVMVSTWGGGC